MKEKTRDTGALAKMKLISTGVLLVLLVIQIAVLTVQGVSSSYDGAQGTMTPMMQGTTNSGTSTSSDQSSSTGTSSNQSSSAGSFWQNATSSNSSGSSTGSSSNSLPNGSGNMMQGGTGAGHGSSGNSALTVTESVIAILMLITGAVYGLATTLFARRRQIEAAKTSTFKTKLIGFATITVLAIVYLVLWCVGVIAASAFVGIFTCLAFAYLAYDLLVKGIVRNLGKKGKATCTQATDTETKTTVTDEAMDIDSVRQPETGSSASEDTATTE